MRKLYVLLALLVLFPHHVDAQTLFYPLCGSGYNCPVDRDYVATDAPGYQTWNNMRFNFGKIITYWKYGAGSPVGTVTGVKGTFYLQTDGVDGTTLWSKTSNTGTGGWIAIPTLTSAGSMTGKAYYAINGAVTTPSFSFVGDTNTGLYWIGADNFGLTTGGTLRLDINTARILGALPYNQSYSFTGSFSASDKYGAFFDTTFTPSGAFGNAAIGGMFHAITTGSQNFTSSIIGGLNKAEMTHSGTVNVAVGAYGVAVRGGGNSTTLIGTRGEVQINGTGTASTAMGFYSATAPISGGGTITMNRGLFIDIPPSSGISFNRAIGIGNQVTGATTNSLSYEQDLPSSGYFRIWGRGQQEVVINDNNSLSVTANDFNAHRLVYNYTGGAPATFLLNSNYVMNATPTADIAQPITALQGAVNFSGTHASSSYFQGVAGNVFSDSSGNVSGMSAVNAFTTITPASGTPTVTDISGMYTGTEVDTGATATSSESIYVDRAYSDGGGTIGKDYGVWLEDRRGYQTAGGTVTTEQHLIHANISGATGKYYVNADGQTVTTSLQLDRNGVSKPTCVATPADRGKFWYTAGGAGVKDNVEVCAKDASDVYAWRTIY